MATNRVIGRAGDLPWRLSADLQYFKKVTMGHPIIMGRKTHESIGRALPGRMNIVVSRQQYYSANGCEIHASLPAALRLVGDVAETMVIGGATLYADALSVAHRIYLTEVHAAPEGDTFFPDIDPESWQEVSRELHLADEENEFDYSFVTLDRLIRD